MKHFLLFILLSSSITSYAGRMYSSEYGRFINQDSAGVEGGINLYNSGSNNMVNGFAGMFGYSGGMSLDVGELVFNYGVDAYGFWYYTEKYKDRNPGFYDDFRCYYTKHYRTGVGFVMEAGDTEDKFLTELGLRRPAQSLSKQVEYYFPGDFGRKRFKAGAFILLSDALDYVLPHTDKLPMLTSERSLSTKGADFIATYEKFMAKVYLDQGGLPTIGFGHLIQPGEDYTGVTLTREQAVKLKQQDLVRFERAVRNGVRVGIRQYEYDAFVSLAYNIGTGGFRRSSALREFNNRNFKLVPIKMALWNKVQGKVSDGLVNRRKDEIELFRLGDYTRNY